MGGNVVLKFLGELGTKAVEKNIRGAAACCVPFDPIKSQEKLDSGIGRLTYAKVSYGWNLISELSGIVSSSVFTTKHYQES
jgi:predicted alpha/beta-fold hydrolase